MRSASAPPASPARKTLEEFDFDHQRSLKRDVIAHLGRHGESFGVVLLEAMAAGLPVVASDLPGYRELSNDRTAARLVPHGDPAALARELIRVLCDDHLADSLRTAGLHQARRFSVDALAKRYVEIYDGLVVTTR